MNYQIQKTYLVKKVAWGLADFGAIFNESPIKYSVSKKASDSFDIYGGKSFSITSTFALSTFMLL